MNIQFGKINPVKVNKNGKVKMPPRNVKQPAEPGLEKNGHAVYDTEVNFANIKPVVNVTRTKIDDASEVGVAKGAILDHVPITVPSNTAGATLHAMKKRCDFKPSLISEKHFVEGHRLLMDKFLPLDEIRMDGDTVAQYLQGCKTSKSQRLMDALGSEQLNSDMGTKHVFAKQEVLLKPHGAQPRVVYQGTDMYNALTGPIVMEINARMKKIFSRSNPLNIGNTAIYACGASGEELGDIIGNAQGTAIESDAKNNDGSQSKEFRKYEAMFYRKLGAPLWFVREFANNTKVRVWTRYGIAASLEGQRWSGETTTTTGNSYVHMALMQSAMVNAGVTRSTNLHGGDDYLGFVEGESHVTQKAIEEVYKVSGMVAEVVPQTEKQKATFYRKRYPTSNAGCLPVPQFGRVVSKLNLRANRNTAINDSDYMAGKYLSAAYEHRHVPAIPELLIATSERLSDKPFFDLRDSKMKEMGGPENVKAIVDRAKQHDVHAFDDYLSDVYGITFHELSDVYAKIAESCVQYCKNWVTVVGGKKQNRKGNHAYRPPFLCGSVVDALVNLDVQF